MTTATNLFEWTQTIALTRLGLVVLGRCRTAFLDWRRRARVRAELYRLSDADLRDLGISRGEIEYIAARPTDHLRGDVFPR